HTAHLNAIVNFGKENGTISKDLNVKLPVYSMLHSGRDISKTEITGIFKLLKREMKRDPSLREATTISLALFMLNIAFQGLAPTDFARLKVGDVSFTSLSLYNKEYSGRKKDAKEEVVIVNTYRQKTKQPVKIVAVSGPVKDILKALMKGKNSDDFLLPCFKTGREYTAEQRQNRLANFFNKMSRVINSELRKNGVLFTRTKITFYYARHAFCNLVDSLDIPRHLIQYLIGHRVSVLERNYLRQISSSEQAAISKRLFALIS
ncbi:MAG: hypothetical protein K2G69_07280, partial [Muribaculaceae bacterium]|nr:hypothetical protein [Muribaculaceae bacterium]